MFNRIFLISFVLLAIILTPNAKQSFSARADLKPVDYAIRLCPLFEASPLITECDVDGWRSTVTIVIDTDSATAREACRVFVQNVDPVFKRQWKLRIASPYSGNNAIASCTLP